MSTPVLIKSWQFDVNKPTGSALSALISCQKTMFEIKSSLCSFTSSPWQVWQSCDSVAYGTPGDGVDRWSDYTKLVWAASPTAHSWIVLSQAGLGGKSAICIDLNNATPSAGAVVFSPYTGFGVANGGTDGTATDRPTAYDEMVLCVPTGSWGGPASSLPTNLHVFQSTDGQCTRVVMCRSGVCVGFWLFDIVRNPMSFWTTPLVGVALGNSALTPRATYSDLAASQPSRSRISGDLCYMSWTGESIYGSSNYWMPTALIFPDDDTDEWALLNIGLANIQFHMNHRGRKGELFDIWWATNVPMTGDMYPADSTKQFIQFQDIVLPWNGTTPLIW